MTYPVTWRPIVAVLPVRYHHVTVHDESDGYWRLSIHDWLGMLWRDTVGIPVP